VELNWSTFILEIINFLVLVWILKHFFYKPVLEVIAQRQAGIEKKLTEAKDMQASAEQLQTQYKGRLADWEQERQQARDTLSQEIEAERTRKLAELQALLEQEKEKVKVKEARLLADEQHKMEQTALKQGARFATYLLKQAAGPETEARLIELVIGTLSQQPAERIEVLRNTYGQTPESIKISSAFPISAKQRQQLKQALVSVTGLELPIHYQEDNDLVAGIAITIGAWVLAANLRDELHGFMELSHDEKNI
jgi:F-type H+-transporting ATPase subunit b